MRLSLATGLHDKRHVKVTSRSRVIVARRAWRTFAPGLGLALGASATALAIWFGASFRPWQIGWRRPPGWMARIAAAEIHGAAVEFMIDHHGCPRLEELVAERYLKRPVVDPWRMPYDVRCQGDVVIARSSGPDRLLDTEDDVTAGAQE